MKTDQTNSRRSSVTTIAATFGMVICAVAGLVIGYAFVITFPAPTNTTVTVTASGGTLAFAPPGTTSTFTRTVVSGGLTILSIDTSTKTATFTTISKTTTSTTTTTSLTETTTDVVTTTSSTTTTALVPVTIEGQFSYTTSCPIFSNCSYAISGAYANVGQMPSDIVSVTFNFYSDPNSTGQVLCTLTDVLGTTSPQSVYLLQPTTCYSSYNTTPASFGWYFTY